MLFFSFSLIQQGNPLKIHTSFHDGFGWLDLLVKPLYMSQNHVCLPKMLAFYSQWKVICVKTKTNVSFYCMWEKIFMLIYSKNITFLFKPVIFLFKTAKGSFFQKQPPEVFYKKAVIKISAIFTGKHLWWSLFLAKLQASGLQRY